MALRKLSIKSSEIVNKVLNLLSESGMDIDENTPVKIDRSNGVYDPVYVRIYEINPEDRFSRIVFAYGEYDNEGVFHSDPEVHLGYLSKYAQYFPYYVKAGSGNKVIEKRSAEFDEHGKIIWENDPKIQRDVHSFTNSFLNQIRDQQDLSFE